MIKLWDPHLDPQLPEQSHRNCSAARGLEAMGPSEVLEVGESCCDEAGRSVLVRR